MYFEDLRCSIYECLIDKDFPTLQNESTAKPTKCIRPVCRKACPCYKNLKATSQLGIKRLALPALGIRCNEVTYGNKRLAALPYTNIRVHKTTCEDDPARPRHRRSRDHIAATLLHGIAVPSIVLRSSPSCVNPSRFARNMQETQRNRWRG